MIQFKQGFNLFSQHGFGLMDAMAAMTIISVTTLGLSYSIVSSGKVRQTHENFLALQSAKSAIRATLRDPESYSDTVKEQLAQGNTANFNINFRPSTGSADDGSSVAGFNFSSTGQFFIRKDQSSCGGFNDETCFLRVSTTFQALPGGGLGFSLSFILNPSFQESMPPGDAQVSVRLPNEIFKTTADNNCAGNVALRGFDRDTGEVTCIFPPPVGTTCPNGQYAKGFNLTPSGELVLDCGVPSQQVICPANYSVRSFSAAQLDAGVKSGECLFTSQNTASRPDVYTGDTIVGQACPPNYRLTSSCSGVTVVHNQPGRCTKVCQSGNSFYDCSYNVPAVAGSLVNSSNVENGYVNCRVTTPTQASRPGDCIDWSPPYWAGTTTYSVSCARSASVPEIVSVQ